MLQIYPELLLNIPVTTTMYFKGFTQIVSGFTTDMLQQLMFVGRSIMGFWREQHSLSVLYDTWNVLCSFSEIESIDTSQTWFSKE